MFNQITTLFHRRPESRWYFAALFFGFAGLQTHAFLVGWLAYAITGSNKAVAAVMLVSGLTSVVVSAVLGLLVDRTRSLKRLMQLCFLGLGTIALGIGLQIEAGLHVVHLLIASVFKSVMVSIYDAGRQAMLPQFSRTNEMTSATGIVRVGSYLASITMPPLAGWAIASMHAHRLDITPVEYVYYGVAGLFVIAFLLMSALPDELRQRDGGDAQSKASFLDGLRYVAATPVVRNLLLVNWILTTFGILFMTLIPGYIVGALHVGPGHYGTLFAIWSVGGLAGSLLAASLHGKRRGRTVLLAAAVSASAFLLLGWQSSYHAALLWAGVMGIGQGLHVSLTSALLQTYVHRAFLGRIFGLETLQFASLQVAAYWIGHGADLHGSALTIGATGAVLLAAVMAVWLLAPVFKDLD